MWVEYMAGGSRSLLDDEGAVLCSLRLCLPFSHFSALLNLSAEATPSPGSFSHDCRKAPCIPGSSLRRGSGRPWFSRLDLIPGCALLCFAVAVVLFGVHPPVIHRTGNPPPSAPYYWIGGLRG